MVTAEPAYLADPRAGAGAGAGADAKSTTTTAAREEELRLSASLEPISLTHSEPSSERSDENVTSTDSDYGDSESGADPLPPCSAVHSLERDMPDFDYSHLVLELRERILEFAKHNPGLYSQVDLEKCAHDDWFLARFLLRHKLDMEAAFEMLKAAMRFNNESLANHLKPQDFPAEFYQLGGLSPYGVDRKGNKMLYLRVRLHRKTPEITSIVQAFIYFNIKKLDEEARGRGISIVIDCSGAGLANADMEMLLFIISTLKNYFPKGLSYFLVHELPWILKPFWHIAKAWVPDEHRQLIKFSDSASILEYVDRDQLPPYLGGTGSEEYSQVPADCTTLEQGAKLWGVDKKTIMRVLNKFRENLPAETIERIERHLKMDQAEADEAAELAVD